MNFYNVRRALEYIITLYTLAGMIKTRFGLVILLFFSCWPKVIKFDA
jgi:hypothetical protein